MDGNGRWAQARGLPRLAGHRAGVENLRRVIRSCVRLGIRHLTIYAFSTENWNRPEGEVRGLLSLIASSIRNELDELDREGVQLRLLGSMERLSPAIQLQVRRAIRRTRNNRRLVLNVAFNYGGRAEIVRAIQKIVLQKTPCHLIDEELVERCLFTHGQPDPDLIIRTGGEMRLSNFLLWQSAYTEFYAANVFWPDFDEILLERAIVEFGDRHRRYGAL